MVPSGRSPFLGRARNCRYFPADRLQLIDRYAPLSGGSALVKLQRKFYYRRLRSGALNAFEASVVRY